MADPAPDEQSSSSDQWMVDMTKVVAIMGIAYTDGKPMPLDKAQHNELVEAVVRLAAHIGITLERKTEPAIVIRKGKNSIRLGAN